MPRRREERPDIISLMIYLFIAFLLLKALRVIPDPPAEVSFDVLLSLGVGGAFFVADLVRRRFEKISRDLDRFEEKMISLEGEIRALRVKVEGLEKLIPLHDRVSRLEARFEEWVKQHG